MTYYTSDGCRYDGMDTDTIIQLRAELGKDTVFISQQDYLSIIAKLNQVQHPD